MFFLAAVVAVMCGMRPRSRKDTPVTDIAKDGSIRFDFHVWHGIQSLIDSYTHITSRDHVIVAYTPDVRESAAWICVALQQRGIVAMQVPMAPWRDPGFCRRLAEQVPKPCDLTGRCILIVLERETASHDEAIQRAFTNYAPEQYLVTRLVNAGSNLFAYGIRTEPEELAARNAAILEQCLGATSLSITTSRGSDLEIRLDQSKFHWISICGLAQPGKFLILPAGEVATFPASISGRLVADFALHASIPTPDDTRLDTCPVTVEIREDKMVSYHSENRSIMNFLDAAFAHENAHRVGELGFGTNTGVTAPVVENSHVNERCPGVHLGFGRHNQAAGEVGYRCEIHVDLIARGGIIRVNDTGNSIDLADLRPSQHPHPLGLACQDVFSVPVMDDDCCGASF